MQNHHARIALHFFVHNEQLPYVPVLYQAVEPVFGLKLKNKIPLILHFITGQQETSVEAKFAFITFSVILTSAFGSLYFVSPLTGLQMNSEYFFINVIPIYINSRMILNFLISL